MSGMSTSDLYAVVDLSKKKIKAASNNEEKGQSSKQEVMLYDVRNSNNFENKNVKQDNTHSSVKHKSQLRQILSSYAVIAFIIIFTWIVLVTTIVTVIVVFLKVSTLESASISVTDQLQNITTAYHSSICEKEIGEKLQNMSASVEDHVKKINSSVVNIYGILDKVNYTLLIVQTSSINNNFSSCNNILSQNFSQSSRNYILRSSDNILWNVYCDMTNMLGGTSLGWMRIAKLDVLDCPRGLQTRINNEIVTCIVADSMLGCTTIIYPTFKVPYSKVTGQIRGYQVGTLDGFRRVDDASIRPDNYVDGVTIVVNDEHVWTLAAGCDCSSSSIKPDVVGNNYTCDKHSSCTRNTFCSRHLWESQKCGESPSPWFFRTLNHTTADIEVRICRDQDRMDEDLALSFIEIYVQ